VLTVAEASLAKSRSSDTHFIHGQYKSYTWHSTSFSNTSNVLLQQATYFSKYMPPYIAYTTKLFGLPLPLFTCCYTCFLQLLQADLVLLVACRLVKYLPPPPPNSTSSCYFFFIHLLFEQHNAQDPLLSCNSVLDFLPPLLQKDQPRSALLVLPLQSCWYKVQSCWYKALKTLQEQ
jgi:hypothetical protein